MQNASPKIESIADMIFSHFGGTVAGSQQYARSLKDLHSLQTLLTVVQEFTKRIDQGFKKPTPKEIRERYFQVVKQSELGGECKDCHGTGYLIAVQESTSTKPYEWRKEGLKATDDLAVIYLVCPCSSGDARVKKEDEETITMALRKDYKAKYAMGAMGDVDVLARVDDFIMRCSRLKHKNMPEALDPELSKEIDDVLAEIMQKHTKRKAS